MEEMGVQFVNYMSSFGYDGILKALGRNMRDFLNGLDNLHEYMRFSYPKLKAPSFFVENENAFGLTLHYRSKRKGFVYYVKGQLKQVGKIFYNQDVKIGIVSQTIIDDLLHVIFRLTFRNEAYIEAQIKKKAIDSVYQQFLNLPLKSETFFKIFPFHVLFKKNMEIVSVGDGLQQVFKHTVSESITDLFTLARPLMNFTWENVSDWPSILVKS